MDILKVTLNGTIHRLMANKISYWAACHTDELDWCLTIVVDGKEVWMSAESQIEAEGASDQIHHYFEQEAHIYQIGGIGVKSTKWAD